jgi:hypothetical protein
MDMTRYPHLVDACGEDADRLADLRALFAAAAYGHGQLENREQETFDRINAMQIAQTEVTKRLERTKRLSPRRH